MEPIPSYVLIDANRMEVRRVLGQGFDSACDLIIDIDCQVKLLAQ